MITSPVAPKSTVPAAWVDRKNPTPYYAQLAAILRVAIARKHRPHDLLPSEAELERTYGVSRTVVRQALAQLASEGLVYRRRGKGSFVAERKYAAALLQTLVSFYDEMAVRGHPPVSKVLTLEQVAAPGDVAANLHLAGGAPVVKLSRLRFVDAEPVVLSTSYIPYDLGSGLLGEDLSRCSLYRLMEQKLGVRIASGTRRIEAAAAKPTEARMLGCRAGAPLLVVNGIACSSDGRPVEVSISKHRADRTTFETHLVRAPAGTPMSGRQSTMLRSDNPGSPAGAGRDRAGGSGRAARRE